MYRNLFLGVLIAATALLASGCASTPKPPAGVSFDGLELVPDTSFASVYKKPGADISTYTVYALAPCEVAFRENWLRDQNRDRKDLSSRLNQQDVEKIKLNLGAACDNYFRAALSEEPAYNLTDGSSQDQPVLVLHPSIINLDITAPDKMSPGRSRTYTTSAGEMTLLLELTDATTGEVLVRVVDRRKDFQDTRLEWTNSVTNRAEADRVLRRWSKQLREDLDRANAPS